ncbi:elastin-like [Microplitis demolitor]|uniref:elastin-like n=1 Tax=Microplitis demolitor TaxID=69319 RepID=UPI0006D51C33|nr:elastin-like [Microplitis demolitor]
MKAVIFALFAIIAAVQGQYGYPMNPYMQPMGAYPSPMVYPHPVQPVQMMPQTASADNSNSNSNTNLAPKCSGQFLGNAPSATAISGNRGAAAIADSNGWSPSGYGYGPRPGLGYNSMPMDPSFGGNYPGYNNYPMGSLFMPAPGLGIPPAGLGIPPGGLGFSPAGLGIPPGGLGIPSGGLGAPTGYGSSPFGGLPPQGIGMPYPSMTGLGYGDAGLGMSGSAMGFPQPGYTAVQPMPMMVQPQSTQMTENDNANTNININHEMGLHHPGIPKGLLGLGRM